MLIRILSTIWAATCVIIAGSTAGSMLIGYAPSLGRDGEFAKAELAGIERVRNAWASGVWLTSALLASNALLLAVVLWNAARKSEISRGN
jgi:hypothetical protein